MRRRHHHAHRDRQRHPTNETGHGRSPPNGHGKAGEPSALFPRHTGPNGLGSPTLKGQHSIFQITSLLLEADPATRPHCQISGSTPSPPRPTVSDGLDSRFRYVLRTGSTSRPKRASSRRSRSCHDDSAVISRLEAPGSTARGGKKGHQQTFIHTHQLSAAAELANHGPPICFIFPDPEMVPGIFLPAEEPALRCPHRHIGPAPA